jgi:hypothetical protein
MTKNNCEVSCMIKAAQGVDKSTIIAQILGYSPPLRIDPASQGVLS